MAGLLLFWNQPEQFPPSGGNNNHFCQNHFAQNHFAPYHFRPDKDEPVPPPTPPDNPHLGAGTSRFPDSITCEDELLLCIIKELAKEDEIWLL